MVHITIFWFVLVIVLSLAAGGQIAATVEYIRNYNLTEEEIEKISAGREAAEKEAARIRDAARRLKAAL